MNYFRLSLDMHLFLVVLEHHEIGAGVLEGLQLVLLRLEVLLEILEAVVEAGELVDLLLVAQRDVDLATSLKCRFDQRLLSGLRCPCHLLTSDLDILA